jgi:hypothetical protein
MLGSHKKRFETATTKNIPNITIFIRGKNNGRILFVFFISLFCTLTGFYAGQTGSQLLHQNCFFRFQ